MSDGQAFELPTLVPPTTASDCSSSRPPTVFSTPDTMPDAPNSGSNMRTRPPGLGNQVKTLPTPTAAKAGNDLTLTKSGDGREVPNKLGWAIATVTEGQMLPTPRAVDHHATMGSPGAARQ